MLKNENFANIAKTFAAKHVVGEKANADYMEMLKYYPENDPDEFKNGWCCAFVYHCCREAGINLPLGTHKTARKGHFRWFTPLSHGLSGRRLITSYIMKVLTLLRSEAILLYTTTSFPNCTSRRTAYGVTMLELSFHVIANI